MIFFSDFISGNGWVGRFSKLNSGESADLLNLREIDPKKYPFLLESSSRGNERNRFSILFYKPRILIKKEKDDNDSFLKKLDEHWIDQKIEQDELLWKGKKIPFCGGWFIYLGYELAKEIEPSLKIPDSPFQLPTAFAARINTAIIFDHIDNEIFITSDKEIDYEKDFNEIIHDFKKTLKKSKIRKEMGSAEISMKGSDKEHQRHVRTCIDYIFQGEIFQANLSRQWKFKIKDNLDDIDIYRQLRKKNPAPFSGLVSYENTSIISSSPERLVSVDGENLQTRPIAGTRPRGRSGLIDIELSKELINSDKEKAEHLMLLDLERNDISKVCKAGSVNVNEMMTIESYAHVHHIVSNVCGKKLDNVTPGEIITSVFPGGTITGCPKVRCMQILGELEKVGRGPYTGSFGYITHSGNMDINILIRSILRENQNLFLELVAEL